jgi:hypothetical protein
MTSPRHPAAYVRIPGAWARHTMVHEAGQRGWPAPEIYAEDERASAGRYGPALDRLEAAIVAGRHDALLMAAPGDPGLLFRLLSRCTKHGVAVSFLPGPAASSPGAAPAPVSAASSGGGGANAAGPNGAASNGAGPHGHEGLEAWDVLAQARLEALAGLFPDWRIWLDRNGWHARRRDSFVQGYRSGAPAFHVRAANALDLAAQLCWQQAAETHTPDGCQASMLCPPPWGGLGAVAAGS